MAENAIPLWLTIVYTVFMAVLLPVYFHYYGPTNFLYFCDVALLITLVGMWTGSSLMISMCAVGIVAVQMVWVIDFVSGFFGGTLTGMTDYMFDANRSLFLRGLSLFHGWLPFLLIYLVYKLGYDPRGFIYWTVLAAVLILICFYLMPGPRPDRGMTPVNINYVWGMNDSEPQKWVHPYVWLAAMIFIMPLIAYWPTHWLLKKYFGE